MRILAKVEVEAEQSSYLDEPYECIDIVITEEDIMEIAKKKALEESGSTWVEVQKIEFDFSIYNEDI